MTGDVGLFGEEGRREERVEWGNRAPADCYLHGPKGSVSAASDEKQARYRAEQTYWGPSGPYYLEVVSRKVVTYTTAWAPASEASQ